MNQKLIVLIIYIAAGFLSSRAFAEDADTYQHLDPNILESILNEKPVEEKPAPRSSILKPEIKAAEDQKILKKNILEKVARQADKLVSAQKSLQAQTSPIEAEIEHCPSGQCDNAYWVKDAKFEQCSRGNNYLEARLENLEKNSPLFHFLSTSHPEMEQVIKPNCVQAFMEAKGKGTAGGIYRACSAEVGVTSLKAQRPCVSEKYVNMTANSFNLAGSCLTNIPDYIKNVAAKIYPQESGFHVNAMNPMSNDAGSGIGQLTKAAIEDVNKSSITQTKKLLAESTNSSCRAIESELMQDKAPMSSSPAMACNRLNIEKGNPLLNIIYSLSLLSLKQKSLDKNTFNDPEYSKKFNLSPHDLARAKEAVLTWAYNAGQTVATPVKAVLDDYYSNRPVTDVKVFLEQVENSIYNYKRAKNIKKGRKNPDSMAHINSRYYSAVNNSFDLIDKNLEGGKCLLNP